METLEPASSTLSETSSLYPDLTSPLPAEYFEPRWYAAYTCANREKRTAYHLAQYAIEHFLPLYESVRRWKDRRVRLQLPLFPGYVFVRLALQHRLQVLQIPSVVRLVGFNGLPTPLSDAEMEALRNVLLRRRRAEPHPYLTAGRRVRIFRGPLEGVEGVLLRRKGNLRVVLSLELIRRSIVVDADVADVVPLSGRKGN